MAFLRCSRELLIPAAGVMHVEAKVLLSGCPRGRGGLPWGRPYILRSRGPLPLPQRISAQAHAAAGPTATDVFTALERDQGPSPPLSVHMVPMATMHVPGAHPPRVRVQPETQRPRLLRRQDPRHTAGFQQRAHSGDPTSMMSGGDVAVRSDESESTETARGRGRARARILVQPGGGRGSAPTLCHPL